MNVDGKTFININAANGAITAAEATWVRPSYIDLGDGRHVIHAILPEQRLSIPLELLNGRWVVFADHPGMKGELINILTELKNIHELPVQAQAVVQPPGQAKKNG